MVAAKPNCRRALALLAVASALASASATSLPGGHGGSWWKRQEPLDDAQVLKLISATGPYATMAGTNANAIQSAVGMSGNTTASIASSATGPAATAATPAEKVEAVQASSSPSGSAADKVATDQLSANQEAQLENLRSAVSGNAASDAKGELQSWTYDPGAYGCGFANDPSTDVATATLCSVNGPAPTGASSGNSEQVLANADTPSVAAAAPGAFATVSSAAGARRAIPTPEPERRQYPINEADTSSNLFPLFTSYVTRDPPSTTAVNFGPTSNLNASVPRRAGSDSGNGQAPQNINNPNSPDLGWLDVQVGSVPYKNGDLIASIVWVLATIALIPLLLIRMLRRSSLISMVLVTVIIFMVLMLIAFGIRAKLSDTTPTLTLMNVEGIILAILLPLLIEPLLHLLGLYSKQSGRTTGVPQASLILRILNLAVFILFLVAGAYYANWLSKWNKALQMTQTAQDLPPIAPYKVIRIAPVVASVIEIIVILGAALLIPVARGDSGSLRPGGFIFLLLVLLFISAVWRLLQTLHATTRLSAELGGNLSSDDLLPFFQGGSPNTTTNNHRVAHGLSLAPQGMYGPNSEGIDWEQLQLTMASRSTPQTPLIFNLVYVLPMWLMVFLLFFAHAPSKKKHGDDGDGNVAVAKA